MRIRSILTVSAVFGFAALTAAAAVAAEAAQESVPISYRDLDLKTNAGVAALDRRIAHAAGLVCGSVDPRALDLADRVRACRAKAIADARSEAQAMIAAVRAGTVAMTAN